MYLQGEIGLYQMVILTLKRMDIFQMKNLLLKLLKRFGCRFIEKTFWMKNHFMQHFKVIAFG